jgi:hypothetical protein
VAAVAANENRKKQEEISSLIQELLGISFLPILEEQGARDMKSCVSTIGLGIAMFAFFGFQPAVAGCQLIHATHSAPSHAKAVETSRALALQSAYDLQRASGWRHITLSAHPVQGDPFWKAVRPKGVPEHARLQPDLVTAQFYTTCFTGVVVRYVCTTGSSVCGQ